MELVGEDRAAAGPVAACDAQAGVVAGLQRQVADHGPASDLHVCDVGSGERLILP